MTVHADFEERFEELARIAHRVAHRLLGDRGDAEDVAQEALARAYVRWPAVRDHAEPWVARVATNLAIERWRKRRPSASVDALALVGRSDRNEVIELRMALVEALRRLPRRQREVVVLRYLADLPERQVAEALRTSVGSVKQHTHRALGRLRADERLIPALQEADDVR
jgi:RNA polymerase sigma-70 factor (sigma-E family)